MIYVMSDIHGEYDKYCAMLRKINFRDTDILFVLGDVVDRGPEPAKVLLDMSMRSNVYPLMGNHELMALDILKTLSVEVTEENYDQQITEDVLLKLADWQMNGGDTTLKAFHALPADDRLALIEYMEEFEPYQVLDTPDGRTFILVHAGLGNYQDDKPMDAYTLEELTFARPELERQFYGGSVTVVAGHTPTLGLTGKAELLQTGNLCLIDCGAAYGGRLCCLCLDTMQAFYV